MLHQSITEIVTSRPIRVVHPDQTVREACYILREAEEGAVAVVEDGKLVGILGEHDVIARAICANRPTRETAIREIMTHHPKTVSSTASLAEAMKIMGDGGFRHLPVIGDEALLGILSMRDIPTQYRLLVERFQEFQPRNKAQSQDGQLTMLV
ncbi:MAG: cyclic nucleotide-binding/CBS domain-containing protein [Mangrovicoccus sp.]